MCGDTTHPPISPEDRRAAVEWSKLLANRGVPGGGGGTSRARGRIATAGRSGPRRTPPRGPPTPPAPIGEDGMPASPNPAFVAGVPMDEEDWLLEDKEDMVPPKTKEGLFFHYFPI